MHSEQSLTTVDSSSYTPQVNDYVVWHSDHVTLEGWVYFFCSEYITIEVSVKNKTEESMKCGTHHRKDHCLVVCPCMYWNDLEFIKKR